MFMKSRKFKFYFILLFFLMVLPSACKKAKEKEKNAHVIVAQVKKNVKTSFYVGYLQPITNIPLISPVDGRVEEVHFDYGKNVTKDQLMLVINSSQLVEQYQGAVKDYLQSKDAYTNAIESFQGTVALYKAGVISRDNYNSDKSSYDNTVLTYFQARYKLQDVLTKLHIDPSTIEKLTLENKAILNRVLYRRFDHIEVHSPGAGIALFPTRRS